MNHFSDFLLYFMETFFRFITNPLFFLVMLLVFSQYYRVAKMEKKMFGRTINKAFEQGLKSLALGCFGGFLASGLLLFFGIYIDRIGIIFIWPLVILLLLINPRFLCFAYAGGILAVGVFVAQFFAVLFPWITGNEFIAALLEIHLSGLLVLVAVLHLVESLFIYIGGHWGSTPVFFKGPDGKVTGGFSLQRFWPVPLVGIIAVLQPENAITMPEWWPLLKAGIDPLARAEFFFLMFPVMAGLGYADLALSSTPREKTNLSARFLGLYSVVLLALAIAADFYPVFLIPACLFAPLGHELVVYFGNRAEFSRPPRYRQPEDGIMVLAVHPDSPAEKAGLKTEDVVEKVNGEPVEDSAHFWQLINESYFLVNLTVKRADSRSIIVLKKDSANTAESSKTAFRRRRSLLGLILVPDKNSPIYVELRNYSPLKNILNRFKKKKN